MIRRFFLLSLQAKIDANFREKCQNMSKIGRSCRENEGYLTPLSKHKFHFDASVLVCQIHFFFVDQFCVLQVKENYLTLKDFDF